MQRTLTSAELVDFVERISPGLDWSTRYTDLAATTVGAVFRALGLDEDSDVIAVGRSVVSDQIIRLEVDLRRRGRSQKTITTYKTVWKRISTLAEDWLVARDSGKETTFWKSTDKYKDTRRRRRTTRSEQSAVSGQLVSSVVSFEPSAPLSDGEVLTIPVDDGTVTIQLPYRLSRSETMKVVEAILYGPHSRDDTTPP